jgi:hypothetical protein
MATLTVTNELLYNLQKIAEAESLSVDELATNVLNHYVTGRLATNGEEPGDDEITAVNASIVEAEKPDAIWYSDKEFDKELNRVIAARRANKRTGAA